MSDKVITIGIGVYKRKRSFMQITLSSILYNLHEHGYLDKVNIMVVNDCDYHVQDFKIAMQFKQKYTDTIILSDNKQNKGIAYTYRKMIQECNTQFFMPFDSDDYFYDFDIIKQCNILSQNQQYCGSYGVRRFCDIASQLCSDLFLGNQYILENFINFDCAITHNAMILKTKDAIFTGNYFPNYLDNNAVKVSCDYSMFVAMLLYKDLMFRNQIRVLYNSHDNCFHTEKVSLFPQEFKSIANGVVSYCQKNRFNYLNMYPLYYSAKKFLSNVQFYVKNSWLSQHI